MSTTKIALIGAGRMASAIVDGLLAKNAARPADLACIGGPNDDTARALAERTGIAVHADCASLLADADTVILACKPQQLAGLDPRLAELTAGRLVLSILAGKRLARLAEACPRARNVVRVMPNTPGQIGAGVSGWCSLTPLSASDREIVLRILRSLGQAVEFDESQLDAVTGLSGSGPAYVFEFAAALRDGGEAAGLPRDAAYKLALETVLGAARLLARTGSEPETLRDQVTSPNGTTLAGLQVMSARDFRATIKETVLAATRRSAELSKD